MASSRRSGRVDLASYLKKLAEPFLWSQSLAAGSVRLDLHTSPVHLAIDQAVPCGLIVNEMLTNSLKHGFAEGKGGLVSLELGTLPDGLVRMVLGDSGLGLPSDFEARRARSLSLQLISDPARQVGGCLDSGPGPAARFAVTFRRQSTIRPAICANRGLHDRAPSAAAATCRSLT